MNFIEPDQSDPNQIEDQNAKPQPPEEFKKFQIDGYSYKYKGPFIISTENQ